MNFTQARPFLKPLHYVLVSVVGGSVFVPIVEGHGLNWATVVAVLGAVAVYLTRNTPKQPMARAVAASYAAGVMVLVTAFTDQHITALEWQQILLAALGARVVLDSSDEIGPITAAGSSTVVR